MTIERACEILDPEHREHYDSIEPVNEACRMGISALRAQQWIGVADRLPERDAEYYERDSEWPTYIVMLESGIIPTIAK